MDWAFVLALLSGDIYNSGDILVSIPTYLSVLPLLGYIFAPKYGEKIISFTEQEKQNRTTKIRVLSVAAFVLLLFVSLVLSANYLYQRHPMTLKHQLAEWAWKSGASAQEVDSSTSDFRGRPVTFGLQTIHHKEVVINIMQPIGNPDIMYFYAPIDDPISVGIYNGLSADNQKKLINELITVFIRAPGLFYEVSGDPMYIYKVIPISDLSYGTFIDLVVAIRKEITIARNIFTGYQ